MNDVLIKAKCEEEEFEFKLSDLYGYEGETCGIIIANDKYNMGSIALSYNSGYGFNGMNDKITILSAEVIQNDSMRKDD